MTPSNQNEPSPALAVVSGSATCLVCAGSGKIFTMAPKSMRGWRKCERCKGTGDQGAWELKIENEKLRDALLAARGGLCVAAIKDGTLQMINEALSLPNAKDQTDAGDNQ